MLAAVSNPTLLQAAQQEGVDPGLFTASELGMTRSEYLANSEAFKRSTLGVISSLEEKYQMTPEQFAETFTSGRVLDMQSSMMEFQDVLTTLDPILTGM